MHKLELNLQTNEIKEIPLSQNEINEINIKLAESASLAEEKKINEANKLAKLESAKAKLTALGLDEEEVKAILGV